MGLRFSSQVFGRRQQMGLRKAIKDKKKNKNAVAEEDAEKDCAPKSASKRARGSKSKLKSRGLKKLKSMKAALEEEEEEDQEQEGQEQEAEEEVVKSWRDVPEVRARVKTSVPKCKAAAKNGKGAEKSAFEAHLDELAKEEPTAKASKGKGRGKRAKKDDQANDQAEDGAEKPSSGKAKKAKKDAGEEPAPGKAKKAKKDAGEEPASGKAKKAKKDAGEEPASGSGRAKKAKKDACEEPASGRAKKATKDASEEPVSGKAKKAKVTEDAGAKNKRPTKKDIEQAKSNKDDVEYMLEYATSFPNTTDMDKLKKDVREWLPAWTFVYPDIYWTTGQCGLMLLWSDKGGKRRKTTVGSFSFGGKPTQLLVAISCSLLLVSCFD
eukprot:s3633_g10.t1